MKNSMKSGFCGECGAALPSQNTKICVKCGSEPFSHAIYCTYCGEKAKSKNAVLCTKCGATLKPGVMKAGKDPSVALLIALVGMFLSVPAIGYIYLENVKKGLIYLLINWVAVGVIVIFYSVVSAITGGVGLCCFPALLIPLIVSLLIVYDVYVEAKGEKSILPGFRSNS